MLVGVGVNRGVRVGAGVAVFGFGVGRFGVFVPVSAGREAGVSVRVESSAGVPVFEGGTCLAERSIPIATISRKMIKSGRGFPIQAVRVSIRLGLDSGSGVGSLLRGFMLRGILIQRAKLDVWLVKFDGSPMVLNRTGGGIEMYNLTNST